MLTIARLFGKSPFAPLQTHMQKVVLCMGKLEAIFVSLEEGDQKRVETLVQELCVLEHEADLTKNDIRNHLPRTLFLPVERPHFLDILAAQDRLADTAEEIGLLLTLRPLPLDGIERELFSFLKKSLAVFHEAQKIIAEIDELLESSFGGLEAEKVKGMVEQTAHREHEAQRAAQHMLRIIFSVGEELSAPSFYLLLQLVEKIGAIAELSEQLANRIRMILEVR